MPAARDQRRSLIEANLPLARRLALRYAGRGEQTDDLIQVGALALVRAVDRCDPERRELPAYLARCVDGELRHHLRDRASVVRVPRTVPRPVGPVLPIDAAETAAAPALDESLFERATVAGAIQRLDERERRILLALYVCERTQAEVAVLVGLSQAQVSRIAHRALSKLRCQLDGPLSGGEPAATLRSDGDGRTEAGAVA